VEWRQGPAALERIVRGTAAPLIAPLLATYAMHVAGKRDGARTIRIIQEFVDAHGGSARASADLMDQDVIARWLGALQVARSSARVGESISPATYNRRRAAIATFCTWLMARKPPVLAEHPVRYGRVLRRDEPKGRLPAPFAADDYAKYLAAAGAFREDAGLALQVMLLTDADRGEVLALEGRDIRWGEGGDPTRIRFKRHKTNTPERYVPITDDLGSALDAWVGLMGVGPGRLVFSHLSAPSVRWAHEEHAAPAIGRVGRLTVKDLRHVAAIRWAQAGVPIHRISKWLGHATIEQTMVYIEFVPSGSEERDLLSKLAGTWDGVAVLKSKRRVG
jgi:integrase